MEQYSITEISRFFGVSTETIRKYEKKKILYSVRATGGYLANSELVEQYKPEYAGSSTDVGIGCDGSGLEMALAVGADTKCMDSIVLHALATTYNGASRSLTLPAAQGCIAVNQDGGLSTDNSARVLREDSSVIEGLYAAGHTKTPPEEISSGGFIILTLRQWPCRYRDAYICWQRKSNRWLHKPSLWPPAMWLPWP